MLIIRLVLPYIKFNYAIKTLKNVKGYFGNLDDLRLMSYRTSYVALCRSIDDEINILSVNIAISEDNKIFFQSLFGKSNKPENKKYTLYNRKNEKDQFDLNIYTF